jgi:hypothetical protein
MRARESLIKAGLPTLSREIDARLQDGMVGSTLPTTSDAMSAQPEWVSEAFRLTRREGDQTLTLVCEIWKQPLGWQLRLVVDGHGLEASAMVHSADLIPIRVAEFKAAMLMRGWH